MDIKNGNGKKQTIDALKHTISQWVDNCKYSPGNPVLRMLQLQFILLKSISIIYIITIN